MKEKKQNRLLYLFLAITMIFALFSTFYIKNASAEINTTDEYILKQIEVGDDLSGQILYFNKLYIIDNNNISYTIDTETNQLIYGSTASLLKYTTAEGLETIFDPVSYLSLDFEFQFQLPSDFGIVTAVNYGEGSTFSWGFVKILVLNPDYVPTPTLTEEPQTPFDEVGNIFNNASLGAILLIILGAVLLSKIIR